MKITTMPASQFKDWRCATIHGKRLERGTHSYTASWEENSLVVRDEHGGRVQVTFGSTNDMRTCYAHVEGVGFIGGWTYPHAKRSFQFLVDCINRGIVYPRLECLPKRSKQKTCPHCGGEL